MSIPKPKCAECNRTMKLVSPYDEPDFYVCPSKEHYYSVSYQEWAEKSYDDLKAKFDELRKKTKKARVK